MEERTVNKLLKTNRTAGIKTRQINKEETDEKKGREEKAQKQPTQEEDNQEGVDTGHDHTCAREILLKARTLLARSLQPPRGAAVFIRTSMPI